MTGRRAIVDQRVTFLVFQEPGDIGHADFHFQGRGYSVQRLDALAFYVLAVLVQIDESGSDDQAVAVNDTPPAQRFGRDADNLPVADADVAHGIEAGFGVHDASALEDK